MNHNLTDEIKAKLTPEQLVIAEKWEDERKQREALIEQVEAGTITIREFFDKSEAITPYHCEHDRSIWSTCIACDEIESIIRPESLLEDDEEE
jgi:hypothetical protein